MLHTFTGTAERRAFWSSVAALHGRIVSASAASFVLRCSLEQIHRLIAAGDLEAWEHRDAAGGPARHLVVSIPSLVRHGIRAGRFRSAQDRDLRELNVSPEEFAAMRADVSAAGVASEGIG